MPDSVQDLIRQEAARQGVPPELALGVAEQESSFNPTAINPKAVNGEHATGTFQLLPSTAKGLGVDPTDPRQNIQGGVKYLRQLLDQHQGDLTKVLAAYGGVKDDTGYVPGVLTRVNRWKTYDPLKPNILRSDVPGGPPAPTSTLGKGIGKVREFLGGYDIGTPGGRQNVAGAAGAMAATALAPELAGPAWLARAASVLTPVLGAGAGGAVAQAGEDVAAGGPPRPSAMLQAAGSQAGTEVVGQGITRGIVQPVARRLAAGTISSRISTALDNALEAAKQRIGMTKPSVSPSTAGTLAHDVAYGAQGAAKTVKDQLGEAVGAAAKTGPDLPNAPLLQRLQDLKAQINPAPPPPTTILPVGKAGPSAASQAIAAKQQQLLTALVPPDHPLPGVLNAIEEHLNQSPTTSFDDAHKMKRLLDEAVNWDSPAKKQVQQITKGFRQTLRQTMSSHQSYNEATGAYKAVNDLYDADAIKALRNAAQTNPSVVVTKLKANNPNGVQMVRELLKDVPTMGTPQGAQEGEAAWNAVRAAWTHDNLFAKGPAGMSAAIQKIEASGNGPQFIQAMYGDQQGQTIWKNAKQLAGAWQTAEDRVKGFSQSDLANAVPLSGAARDAALALMPHHTIGKVGAVSRFLWGKGTGVSEMLEHAAHSDATTQFLVKHVLTGPDPGMAVADFMRWYQDSGGAPEKPVASHEQTAGGPPVPASIATR